MNVLEALEALKSHKILKMKHKELSRFIVMLHCKPFADENVYEIEEPCDNKTRPIDLSEIELNGRPRILFEALLTAEWTEISEQQLLEELQAIWDKNCRKEEQET